MSPSALADLSPLPSGLRELLDAFRGVYGDPAIRLFAGAHGAWRCLYPDADPASCPDSRALTVPVVIGDETPLVLESPAGSVEPADLEFLARALSRAIAQEREAQSAARELIERYEEINLLYLISEILGSVLSVSDAASRILTEVADVLGARRASLWVYRADEDALHLVAAVGDDGLHGPIPAADAGSVTARVFREKQTVNVEGGPLQRDRPPPERPGAREAFLSVPISYTPPDGGARTVGVITLVGRRMGSAFSAGDARLLCAIASQIGAALETQRLVHESLRQERMVRELELAHDLQLKLLPDPRAFEDTVQLAARCVPADSVGGDFYQLHRLPGGRLGIMIGDVSSHGFPAAMIMALVMSAAGIHALESGAPADVLHRVQQALLQELESTEMYLSLFYAVVDRAADRVVWANAGHPQAFHLPLTGEPVRLGATGPPLGLVPGARFDELAKTWAVGDLLLLFTDGLSDSLADEDAGLSGEVVLLREVTNRRLASLNHTLDDVFRLSDRTRSSLPPDDRSILLVRR